MIRPRTTGHLSEPSKPAEASTDAPTQKIADDIGRSLLALVIVVEGQASAGPAVKAYQAAIRRNGEEAAEAGGSAAMQAALQFVRNAAPERAERRESIIDIGMGRPARRASTALRCEAPPEPATALHGVQNEQERHEPPLPTSSPAPSPRARAHTAGETVHRPFTDRRAQIRALLAAGLSDRAIAHQVRVSPSTVAAVRKEPVRA